MSKFYLFSKLSFSLSLLFILILTGYLFYRSYSSVSVTKNNEVIQKNNLQNSINLNSSKIEKLEILLSENNQKLNNIFDVLDKNNQINSDLLKLIEQLPSDQMDVLKLRYFEDMSFKKISDITGVSINTALGRMRYALINLRKLAQEQHIDLQLK